MSRTTRTFVLAALLLALAGCGGILPPPPPPPQLYRLTPATDFAADLPKVTAPFVVELPFAPAGLDTSRITLSRTPTSIDYFANAEWTDRATGMVQTVLIESLENSGRVAAVGRDAAALQPDYAVQSEIRHFEAVYGAAAAPQVHAEIAVRLVRSADRTVVAQRIFEARADAAQNAVPEIVDAFDRAMHAASQQIVAWLVQSVAAARR